MKAAALVFLAVAMSADAANVLYFRDAPIGADRMAEALTAGGHSVTVATDAADFKTRIESNAHEVGVFFVQKRAASEYAAAIRSLNTFVASGGRALYADWSRNDALAAGFGATFTGRADGRSATLLDLAPAATPVPQPIALRETGWFRSTMGLAALTGSSAAASFENGDAAIVRGATGRSLVFGFLNDTPDFAKVFQRGIEFVLAPSHRPAITLVPMPDTPPQGAVTVHGTILPNGATTGVVVEYGPTTNYGTQTASQDIGAGIAPVAVPVAIAGLPEHTTFHYRFRATNSEGSVVSADHIFRTLNSTPFAGNDRVTAGGAITVQPLANDGDADGDALAIIEVTPASFGTVTFTANSVTYTPGAAGLRGDRFTYTVTDGFGGRATANVIIDLPLDSFRGQYSQLFTGPGGVAGRIQLTLGSGGSFTGQMLFGDLSAVLTGKFEADGVFRGTVSNPGINFAITLALRLDAAVPRLAGTISDGATTWTSDGAAAGPSSFGLKGRYTFVVPDSHQPAIPRGDAWAVFAGNSLGHMRFVGRFADGAKFSGDGEMQPDGVVPIYILRTDAPVESLGGALRFSDVRGTDLTGNFTWTRYAGANGFAATSAIVGSRFVPPAAGKPIFTFRNSAAKIVKATLAADVPGFPKKQIFNVSANRIDAVLPNANGFVLQLSRTTGQLSGTFNHRTLGRCKVSGVFVQPANAVRGNFAGGGVSGSFLLAPR